MSAAALINPSAFEAGMQSVFASQDGANGAQRAAFEQFAKTGLPHRRIEGWKWTDLNAALRTAPSTAKDEAVASGKGSDFQSDPVEIRLVNGRVELSGETRGDGATISVEDIREDDASVSGHPVAALNLAMSSKTLLISMDEGAALGRPLYLRHILSGAGPAFSRIILRVGNGAKVELIESFEGARDGFYSAVTLIEGGEGAVISRSVIQQLGNDTVVHGLCAVDLSDSAVFQQASLSTGSKLSRHETIATLNGDSADAQIDSVSLLTERRHMDFTTHVTHRAPGCRVRQLHKGVAAQKGNAIFQGKFEVERAAQKTDAKMTANALLLSGDAQANHKPELEIYADDVECAHGSTCGALDEEALFYLRQRGLNERGARAMLIAAFVGEVFEGIKSVGVKDQFAQIAAEWLEDYA